MCLAFDAGSTRALYGDRWKKYSDADIKVVKYPPDVSDMDFHKKLWNRNDGKAITVYMLPQELPTGVRLTGNRKLWNVFSILHAKAILDDGVKTVGVDTATIARRVAADCYLETLQASPKTSDRLQLIQIEWSTPNGYIRSMYSTSQNICETATVNGKEKHFIVTHHLTEVRKDYVDSKGEKQSIVQAGQFELEGLNNTLRFVDIGIRVVSTTVPGFPDASKKVPAVEGKFVKNGIIKSLEGESIMNPTWDGLARVFNRHIHPDMQMKYRWEVDNGSR